MFSLKFGFKQNFIFLEEEIFDKSGKLSYTIPAQSSTNGDDTILLLQVFLLCLLYFLWHAT